MTDDSMHGLFRVWGVEHKMERLGNPYDGGYVVSDLDGYDLLISCGIGHNVSFEMDFRAKFPGVPIRMYDPKIERFPRRGLPLLESNSVWKRLFVSDRVGPGKTNLYKLLLGKRDVLLKMDIEGAEVPWIKSLSIENQKRIRQAVIEFHSIKPESLAALRKMLETHVLVHVHGNNYSGEKVEGDFRITRAFEVTLLRKRDAGKIKPYRGPLPIPGLDFPNNRKRPEYDLNREPFTKRTPTP